MNGLIRWESFGGMTNLRQAIDRLFDDSLRPAADTAMNLVPPVDMLETDKELIIKAVLPGIAEDDISVDIVGDTLTIRGETKSEKEDKGETHLNREFRYGTFSRSLTLPGGLKADRAEAEMENGFLKLSIPKAESAKPKAIKVKSKKVEKSLKEAQKTEN